MKTLGIKNFKKDQKTGLNKEAKLPHVASLSDKSQLSNLKSPKKPTTGISPNKEHLQSPRQQEINRKFAHKASMRYE